MQRARQHIPSFMGAYIPPCGDVTGGVVIRVGDKATVCASERFAVPYSDMQTFGTSLRGVRRRYGNDIHTRKFTLVFKETAELGERPRIGSPSECLVALLPIGSFANIGQVLNGYTLILTLCPSVAQVITRGRKAAQKRNKQAKTIYYEADNKSTSH